jgi:ATP-dependent DNA ligase
MLSKPTETEAMLRGALTYEPKWDGFRALVFRRGQQVYVQSRDLRPLDRYFPELVEALRANLPESIVLDGEIVIATKDGLDFQALQLRLHPAASRVAKLAAEMPSSFVAFDLLALGDEDLRALPQIERRARLEAALAHAKAPIHLTPSTRDPVVAEEWFRRFEGAGLDGVIAKPDDAPYQPGKRVMFKIKHARTADCVVAGFRWHKGGENERVGSLLLGLYDAEGRLHHVGVTSSFTMSKRAELVKVLAPLREGALEAHPWRQWLEWSDRPEASATRTRQSPETDPSKMQRMPGGESRWSAGKDLSWVPLRIERVAEVKYDHLEGDRFRHGTTFVRWRDDKRPEDCRYDQLEVTPAYELAKIFGR